jgi:hypothetical protein
MKSAILKLACISTLVGCSVQPNGQSSLRHDAKPAEKIKDVLLYVSGGFRSCERTNFEESAAPLYRELRSKGVLVRYIYSCYDQYSRLHMRVGVPVSGELKQVTADELRDEISLHHSYLESKTTYAIGHSYGGWMALEQAVALQSTAPFSGITIIDSISPIQCTTMTAAWSLAEQSTAIFEGEEGCLSSPVEWRTGTRGTSMIKNLKWFDNYYQTIDPLVHSGALAGASNNTVLYPKSTDGWGEAHRLIDNDHRVWSTFHEQVLKAAGLR